MVNNMPQRISVKELDVVEAPLNVREYWFEGFRRVVVVPDKNDCMLFSVDVHKVYSSLDEIDFNIASKIEDNGVCIIYYTIPVETAPRFQNKKAEWAELVVVKATDKRVEASDVRLYYCDINGFPNKDEVYELYRAIVKLIEKRDPDENPLKAPEIVRRIYKSRGIL